jgi:uncharacterized protein (TIGR02611 family)
MRVIRKTGVTVLGWLLLVVGAAALVLPGPGLLLMVAGLAILSQEYPWAERRVEPIKVKAFEVAAYGVRTWPRILASLVGSLLVVSAGVLWWVDPQIPELWIFGPELPLGGWGTGLSIAVSGLVAIALIGYSIRRFRGKSDDEAAAEGRLAGNR